MRILAKVFSDHPASVGETYFEHMQVAFGFGSRMVLGGLASLAHGLLPCIFLRTGSNQVRYLHDRMVVHRDSRSTGHPTAGSVAQVTELRPGAH